MTRYGDISTFDKRLFALPIIYTGLKKQNSMHLLFSSKRCFQRKLQLVNGKYSSIHLICRSQQLNGWRAGIRGKRSAFHPQFWWIYRDALHGPTTCSNSSGHCRLGRFFIHESQNFASGVQRDFRIKASNKRWYLSTMRSVSYLSSR